MYLLYIYTYKHDDLRMKHDISSSLQQPKLLLGHEPQLSWTSRPMCYHINHQQMAISDV